MVQQRICLFLLLALMALSGCAQLGLGGKQTPEVNLAQGYVMLSQTRLLAADTVRQGVISPNDARHILNVTDTARTTLDAARDAHFKGTPNAAAKGLEIVLALLSPIKKDLEAKVLASKKGVK